jgi:hypothetical protein
MPPHRNERDEPLFMNRMFTSGPSTRISIGCPFLNPLRFLKVKGDIRHVIASQTDAKDVPSRDEAFADNRQRISSNQ